uniref:Coiled-coil domain-containing protein 39 n=1 Tax=Malurus cyaneus samueli TaxID=2593467 RepID=A0A8C5TMS2_9PASS
IIKTAGNYEIRSSFLCDLVTNLPLFEQEMLENKEKEKYLNVDRLTTTATLMEEEILQLRKNNERAVQRKNESGQLLRDREEELSLLYEKVNRREMLCKNGDIKMQVMDEKISFLKLKVAEKKREIRLYFEELPVKNALDANLMKFQIQYSECRDKIKQLEGNYGDATNESRKQEMGGDDPSPRELLKRIEQAELLQKEQRLVKIDFLCEAITDLTDRIRTAAENAKQNILLFAKRTNDLQRKVNDKTQEIRALFAELSMKQALAIRLQQEIGDREQLVMTASLMISQGLPPPSEREWLKSLHNERMQKASAEHPAEEEQGTMPSNAPTTPGEEETLPLPPHTAPLRQSESSSSLRHFKKPPAKSSEM